MVRKDLVVVGTESGNRMTHVESSKKEFDNVIYMQAYKGLDKYNQPMDPYDKRYDWLKMAMEELVDGFQYIHAEQIKRKHITDQIREIIKYNTNILAHDQITALLDQLEGKVHD